MFIIQYSMIDFQDCRGRLIVILPMRGRKHCVFVEGKWVAEYRSGREALAYARSLVANGPADSIDHPPSKSESHEDGAE